MHGSAQGRSGGAQPCRGVPEAACGIGWRPCPPTRAILVVSSGFMPPIRIATSGTPHDSLAAKLARALAPGE